MYEFLTENKKCIILTMEGALESYWNKKKFITTADKGVIVIAEGDTGPTSLEHPCFTTASLSQTSN